MPDSIKSDWIWCEPQNELCEMVSTLPFCSLNLLETCFHLHEIWNLEDEWAQRMEISRWEKRGRERHSGSNLRLLAVFPVLRIQGVGVLVSWDTPMESSLLLPSFSLKSVHVGMTKYVALSPTDGISLPFFNIVQTCLPA